MMPYLPEEQSVSIPVDKVLLEGALSIPKDPRGMVLFSHGSGSSRLSSRNRFVASVLQKDHSATLLVDLLTPKEDEEYQNRFDIGRLTKRLAVIAERLVGGPKTRTLPLGLFGASTGAASALKLAAQTGNRVQAIVSRGGRPDLAMDDLPNVTAPTLLIVGGADATVLALNKLAYAKLGGIKKMEIIPGATHLFEERGALAKVARTASRKRSHVCGPWRSSKDDRERHHPRFSGEPAILDKSWQNIPIRDRTPDGGWPEAP